MESKLSPCKYCMLTALQLQILIKKLFFFAVFGEKVIKMSNTSSASADISHCPLLTTRGQICCVIFTAV